MEKKTLLPFSVAYQSDRIRLIDKVPLNIPLCVSIEPTNICNFKCLMCWQSTDEYKKNGGPFQNMELTLFYKILQDIKDFCELKNAKIKLIKLYSTGEPLLNPHIDEMLREIKAANISHQVEITTNAALLTPELSRSIVTYGLDYLRASIYSVNTDNQKRITQSNVTPKQIQDNIAYLRNYRDKKGLNKPYISAKIMDTHCEENDIFKKMYKNITDEQYIDIPWILPKLKENALDRLYGDKIKGTIAQETYIQSAAYKKRKVCRYPFTHMTIRSNGDVVVCCTDWARDTLLGNIKYKSLEQIWNSKELYDFRVMQLKNKGCNHVLCGTCEIPLKDSREDNLDSLPIERLHYDDKSVK
ncbi:radical SAM/SPASM domain-containing protein [Pectinatus haikarae]|uniref:Radical SAM protein with 4Fe4S-binding SPASM domain n=1 Tax=Pectinatus haikarae TaxID=349096 RepID=A0ABT9YB61_9FIRM|nr:radical SAM/SPASM domain-containing protein [Pectinatus haikarae]MDQ0205058.1 radical SAM protein with 4Fe4S-binding SPASM domain [Pectinatus haikarae]